MKLRISFLIIVAVSIAYSSNAQVTDSLSAPANWFNLDPSLDGIYGVGTEKAYEFLGDREGHPVIVAVIDSGVDIEHEDLKGHIWTNTNEVEGNGLDDDGNGYIDDIYGWNFIGGKDGNINEDTHEMTREYVRLFYRYDGVEEKDLEEGQKDEFKYWTSLKTNFERIYDEAVDDYRFYYGLKLNVVYFDSLLRQELNLEELKSEDLMDVEGDDSLTSIGKGILNFAFMATEGKLSMPEIITELTEGEKHFREQLEFTYNVNFDPRPIVGDDYSNLFERYYGNNDPKGPDAYHGTHVAGIIAADRYNNLGIKGVADKALIMSVRTVPNGDERDKDVANAIRYAVDNGARIINMSFGKGYSYGKIAVDSALQYAQSKGVLMIHASGNEKKNRDVDIRYPIPRLESGIVVDNWIEVGASAYQKDRDFVGSFTNYGKNSVDFFAPGVAIYSTVPDNKYDESDGTSFASPVVAGVAALLMSYYPELNYRQIIEILSSSVEKPDIKVNIPGKEGKIEKFNNLSKTGGLINAYNAVIQADLLVNKSK